MKHLKALSALALAFVLLGFLSGAASAQTAVSVTGRVTDAQGNPLPGLALGLKTYPPAFLEATTDANGLYAFSVPAGNYSLVIVNSQYGGCPSYAGGSYGPWCFRIESSPFDVTQSMTLDLPLPFKRVNVHVVDANAQPIAGAALSTNNPLSDEFTLGGVTFTGNSSYSYDAYTGDGLRTDANGNATLMLLPIPFLYDYSYSITAYPPAETGLPAKTLEPIFIKGDTSLTISYVSSVTLSGRVTDAAGNGLPNQSVELGGSVEQSASTDSNGYYTFSVAPASRQMYLRGGVPVSSGLRAPQSINLTSAPFPVTENMTLDLVLPFQRVNVQVVDANGQPVAGAGLSADAHGVDDLSFGGVPFFGSGWGSSSYFYDTSTGEGMRTDANGNATLWLLPSSDQPWEGDGYTIMAYAPPETGLDYTEVYSVFVTGETNVTLRFAGALPANAPVISSLSPASAEAMGPSFTLVVTGTDFINNSVVRWNGADRSTTFVSSTQLTAAIPSADIALPGTANVTVWTPAPGGGESNSLPFDILPPSDRTAPTVSAKGTTSTGDYTFASWVTQTVQITLTAQDNSGGTGVKKVVYSASGAQPIPLTEVLGSTPSFSITAEGETQVTYAAVDNADNRATDQTVVVKIDKTLPVLGTCPAAGPFLLNSGFQPVGPIVANDEPSGVDSSGSQLSGSVDTSSLGVKPMTFTARDLAGNSSSKTCDYMVLPSATLKVYAALHTVGAGTTPGVQKAPLAMSLKLFDRATVPSAEQKDYATVWNSGAGLVSPLALITGPTATTFGGGLANLYAVQVPAADPANQVTSGRYLVIGKVEGAETYIGAATDPLAPNSVTQEYLQVIQKSDGDRVPAVTIAVPGSLLLITEPAYLEFTSDTELFPIIYESVDGTWNAVVQADPPQGFVSTPGALSVDVSTGQLAAVQFTVQDIGSQWTTTKVTNRIRHKGVDRTVTSSVAMINRQPATTKTPTPTATRTATLTASRTLTPTATMTPMPKPTGTATAVPTATQTPKPKPTSKVVPASPAPKPTATPKKQPTATPMATWTLPPTKTPHLTPTPRDKPTKH